MAVPTIKDTSLFGIEVESSEGTYVAPSAATSYFQPLEDAFEMAPKRDLLDRNVINSSIGPTTPKMGMKSVSGSVGVEFRASGTEGADVDFGYLLKGALGATRSISTTTTTKSSGNTGSALQIQDADISKFNVGDIIVVKETNGHHAAAVTAVDSSSGTANITISPGKASGSFSNSVVISKSLMYYTAATGHPALSLSYYYGNTIRQTAIGCKVKSMALDNYKTGQLAALKFAFEGLTYGAEIDGTAPHTPTYDTGTPPVILSATAYKDGAAIQLNNFSLNLENTIGYMTDVGNANGKVSARVTERKISGSIDPYMDDTTVAYYTLFDAGTTFSLFVRAYNPSSTSGEFTMGSVVSIYLPNCMITEYKKADNEGLLTDQVSFIATRGTAGSTEEMYLGLI